MENFFKDLKVIELAGVLAGPSVGAFFAELGANVIKVENPKTNGDVTRSWKLKSENNEDAVSAYFWSVNTFKTYLSLDISQNKDLNVLYEACKTADIIITNYKFGDAEKLKVDYKTISSINPKIIYASINGFGAKSTRTAYDLILQAESGFMSINGEAKQKALKMPVAMIDLMAGHQLKEAILIALIKKFKNNTGSHINVSLFDSALASLVNQASNWLNAHHLPSQTGSLHPNIAPYGELFDTKDQQLITFAIGSNKQFKALCEIIELPLLAAQSKYKTNQLRVANRSELYVTLYDAIKKINYEYIYQACLKNDVPIGKIRNIKDVFELPEAKKLIKTFIYKKQNVLSVRHTAFQFLDTND